jgi:dTDP-4-dehydrorhamnose reductase
MKILLIGQHGQVGGALEQRWASRADLVAIDQEDVDLSQTDAIATALDDIQPALIVNTAAFTNVDAAESNPETAFAVNAAAPKAIANWATRQNAALVHFSTDYVYGGSGSGARPWREEDEPAPLNVYGESKLAGDRAIAESGAAHLILRTSWVYAAEGQNFLRTMLRLGAEREALAIVDDQIGAPTSADTLADIVVRIIEAAGENPGENLREKGGVVQAVCRGSVSWHGFAEAIFAGARARGADLLVREVRPIPTTEYPTPAQRPLNSRMSLDRLSERFEITTPDWKDALARVLDQVYPADRGNKM